MDALTVLIAGQGCWGKGPSVEAALKAWKKAGAKGTKPAMIVLATDAGAEFDGLGGLSRHADSVALAIKWKE